MWKERMVLALPIALFGLYGLYVYWSEQRGPEVLYIGLGILGLAAIIVLVPLWVLFGLFAIACGVGSIRAREEYPYPAISIVGGLAAIGFGVWMLVARGQPSRDRTSRRGTGRGRYDTAGDGGDSGGYGHGDADHAGSGD